MHISEWLCALAQYWVLLPAAASCYLPMKNKMRFPAKKTAWLCALVLMPFSLAASWAQLAFRLDANQLLLPALFVLFFLYRRTVTAHLSQTLAVYVGVCAIETFPSQLASTKGSPLEEALLQMLLAMVLFVAACSIRRQIVWVLDQVDIPKVWYSTVPLSLVFLVFNVAAEPGSTLLNICGLALLVCIYVLFYQGACRLLQHAQLERRSQLFEMQSHQQQVLQEHMRQTARLHHDFRHSIRLLAALAEQGDLAGIQAHLAEYERGFAEDAPAAFCANATLNALFAYYSEMAAAAHVDIDWKIALPEPLTLSELDLCSLFGNLIENGIKGCETLPESQRHFSLTAEVQQGSLYIVSTNRFDGYVIKGKSGYRSTRHDGHGLGLASVAAVAEKYGGSVRFSNSSEEFFADIVLKV